MILNRDLFCDDYYNDSLTDVINPGFLTKTILNNLPYVFAEKMVNEVTTKMGSFSQSDLTDTVLVLVFIIHNLEMETLKDVC